MWGSGFFSGCCGFGGMMNWPFGGVIRIIVILGFMGFGMRCFGGGRRRWFSRDKSAMEVLKERYVKGEIDKDEFESMKENL
jgi:putative membrane protein